MTRQTLDGILGFIKGFTYAMVFGCFVALVAIAHELIQLTKLLEQILAAVKH